MCIWQQNAVSCPSISVLKRLIFFPELCEKKVLKHFSYFYGLIHYTHVYSIKTYAIQEDLSNHTLYNMSSPVSINSLTKTISRDRPERFTKSYMLTTFWLLMTVWVIVSLFWQILSTHAFVAPISKLLYYINYKMLWMQGSFRNLPHNYV